MKSLGNLSFCSIFNKNNTIFQLLFLYFYQVYARHKKRLLHLFHLIFYLNILFCLKYRFLLFVQLLIFWMLAPVAAFLSCWRDHSVGPDVINTCFIYIVLVKGINYQMLSHWYLYLEEVCQ